VGRIADPGEAWGGRGAERGRIQGRVGKGVRGSRAVVPISVSGCELGRVVGEEQ